MASALTSYDQFFTELGKPPGSPTEYDLSSDQAPTPGPQAQPSQASQPVQVQTGSATQRQTSSQQAQQPVQVNPGSTQNVQTQGFATPSTAPAAQAPKPKKTSTQIQLGQFAAPQGGSEQYAKLFAPLAQQVQQGREQLSGAAQQFSQDVGGLRDYESSGAQAALQAALGPGSTAEQQAAAKSLVGAQYAGPTALDQATMDQLEQLFGRLAPRAGSLQTGLGIEDLLRTQAPALSEGQRRFEAKRIMQDPAYAAQAREYEQGIQELFSDYQRAQEEARAIAEQRTGEEQDIARRSREFLGGERESLSSDLEQAVTQAQERERALEDAYARFQETGSLEDLKALQAFGAEGTDFSKFDTELGRKDVEAEAAKAAIMDDPKYGAIQDVPLMVLGINEHGRETLEFDPAWWKENKDRFPKKKPKDHPEVITRSELKALARERQLALEQGGFSPGSAAAKNQKSVRQEAAKEAGQYAAFDPLYYGQGLGLSEFEPADTRAYVTRKEGEQATRESLATPEDRQRYNLIQELLGEADRIEEVDPYTAGEIRDEAARYVEEQDAEFKNRTEQLEKARKSMVKRTTKARGKVREQRLAKSLGKTLGNETLGSTFGGILKGDPAAAANLPFALAAAPVDTGTQSDISQSASLVKAPKKKKKRIVK